MNLAAEREASRKRQKRQGMTLPETPGERVRGAHRAKVLDPYVRWIRRKTWGGEEPPFQGPEDPAYLVCTRGASLPEFDARVKRLAFASGFKEASCHLWVLFGSVPAYQRFQARIEGIRDILPGSGPIRRRVVHIEIHEPVSEAELRSVWRRIRRVWEEGTPIQEAPPSRPSRTRLTPDDEAALRLFEETPDMSWPERVSIWNRGRARKVTAGSLRMRVTRALPKVGR